MTTELPPLALASISWAYSHFLYFASSAVFDDSRPLLVVWFWTSFLKLPEVLAVEARQGGCVKIQLLFD